MISRIIFFALVAQLVLATPDLCPDPAAAKQLAYKEEIHQDEPQFGRVEKVVSVPTNGKPPTCIILTGDAASKSGGAVSISSIGISKDGGVAVKLVSTIKKGIDAIIEVYTD